MQACFSEEHEAKTGNAQITKGLIELEKYWDALEGDFVRDVVEGDDDKPAKTEHKVNHRVSCLCCHK
jgi:hypothetical protein